MIACRDSCGRWDYGYCGPHLSVISTPRTFRRIIRGADGRAVAYCENGRTVAISYDAAGQRLPARRTPKSQHRDELGRLWTITGSNRPRPHDLSLGWKPLPVRHRRRARRTARRRLFARSHRYAGPRDHPHGNASHSARCVRRSTAGRIRRSRPVRRHRRRRPRLPAASQAGPADRLVRPSRSARWQPQGSSPRIRMDRLSPRRTADRRPLCRLPQQPGLPRRSDWRRVRSLVGHSKRTHLVAATHRRQPPRLVAGHRHVAARLHSGRHRERKSVRPPSGRRP